MKEGNEMPNIREGKAIIKVASDGFIRICNSDILIKNADFNIDTPDTYVYTGAGNTAILKNVPAGMFMQVEIYNTGTGNLTVNTEGGLTIIYDPSGAVNTISVAPNLPIKLVWANNLWLTK